MAKSAAANRHVELEWKFDAPESGVAPCFDGLAAVSRVEKLPTQQLDAVYFDTADKDLAANRVTLRRRTGGADAGWHLKLPAGQARTEIRAPLGENSRVPEELLDVVRAIVRDRPLAPVATISTARDVTMLYGPDGTALAEFCDDRVSAARLTPGSSAADEEASQQWREWELELVDAGVQDAAGVLKRLANRLHDAGAAEAGHGSKLARALGDSPARREPPEDPVHRAVAEQVAALLVWDRAVRDDADDAVHQMRVTIRQIRSLLQASEEEFGLTDDATILTELRELAGILGVARDAEVLAERYSDALHALPPELVRGPVRERLVEGGWQRYKTGLNRSLKAMRSARYFRLLDALDEVVVSSPPPGDDHPHTTIRSGYKRVRNRLKAAHEATTEHDHEDALHRVRKAAKRLRYVAAATGQKKVSEQAKAIQSLLGDHQDSVVSRAHLLTQAAAAHAAGEDTFTYGVLYQREEELAQRCREQLDGAVKALRRSVRDAT
jgi:CHAD domain-containing protein